MKVSEIKCNGIGMTRPAEMVKPTICASVSLFRMRFSTEDIFEKFPSGDYHAGTRFNDNSTVSDRLCSGIVQTAISNYKTEDEDILKGIIESFVYSLSASDMDILIIEAMRNCANTDYYYMYEKQYD